MTLRASSPAEAIDRLTRELSPVGVERVELAGVAGRVLGRDVRADRGSPACDVSAMDGYAMRHADLRAGVVRVACDAPIGRAPVELPADSAARIYTGSAIPVGADLVLKREDVTEHGDTIELSARVASEQVRWVHVRRASENCEAGAIVAGAGSIATPSLMGVLATFGAGSVEARRAVRVAIVVTGDEVLDPSEAPEAWQLRDSHLSGLSAMVASCSWSELAAAQRIADDPESLRAGLGDSLERADLLVTTGGVSVGDRDFVPEVLSELGCRTVFHGVEQRPGRPLLGAIGPNGQAVLGLPGNPVSALVTMRRVGGGVLGWLGGLAHEECHPPRVMLASADGRELHLWWHRLVRMLADGTTSLIETRGSGDVVSAGQATGFVEVPAHASGRGPWAYYPWTFG